MTAAPRKIPVQIRIEPSQHAAWTSAAEADERPLSQWIQRACNAAAKAAGFDPKAEPPTQPKRRGTRARKA